MKWIKQVFFCFVCFLFLCFFLVLTINFYVVGKAKPNILSSEEIQQKHDIDAILVLGCQVRANNTPSAMLEDRLKTGIELYERGIAPRILMSGDHVTAYYNEVQVMKDYAVNQNISSSHIFMDHAGISTYDSVYRAKEIFGLKKVVIVTQSYHLYRALYIANALGLEAYGVSSDTITYSNQWYREIREVLARNKDFVLTFVGAKAKILGSEIPITSDGNITND